jgi:transposase-like protein
MRSTLGAAGTKYQDVTLRKLPCRPLQCDETWSFVGGKDKNLSREKKANGLGSIWTWTALDADTKLIATWVVGGRDAGTAYEFMQDVPDATAHRSLATHRAGSRTGAQPPAARSSGGRDDLRLVPSPNCQIFNRRNCQILARR